MGKILATVLEVRCPNGRCVRRINVRLKADEKIRTVSCWNCNTSLTVYNGVGENNVTVKSGGKNVKFDIVWQNRP